MITMIRALRAMGWLRWRLLLNTFGESWMVSPADMEGAAALAPEARLRLVPNAVDVAGIEPVPPRTDERKVLFVADLSYEPNRGALSFLLEEAMPALWERARDSIGCSSVIPGKHDNAQALLA